MHQYLSQLDYSVFSFFNSWTTVNAVSWFFVICAVYFAYLMPIILLVWWFVAKDRLTARKAIVLSVISAAVARLIVKSVIVSIWTRNRPFIAHSVHDIINKSDNEASFPSGHAIAMFSIAPVVYRYNKKLGVVMYVMAVLTAFSRVIVGVHYPSDVIGGAVLGILIGLLTVKLLDKRLDNFCRAVSALSDKILPFTKSN